MTRCATLIALTDDVYLVVQVFYQPHRAEVEPPRRTGRCWPCRAPTLRRNNAVLGIAHEGTAAPSPVSRNDAVGGRHLVERLGEHRVEQLLELQLLRDRLPRYSTMSRKSTLQTSVRLELSITDLRPNCGRAGATALFYAHAGLRPGVR